MMRAGMAAHQMRSTTAHAPVTNALDEGCSHSFIAGQAQVIVAAKIQQAFAVYQQFAALCRGYQAALPILAALVAILQIFR